MLRSRPLQESRAPIADRLPKFPVGRAGAVLAQALELTDAQAEQRSGFSGREIDIVRDGRRRAVMPNAGSVVSPGIVL